MSVYPGGFCAAVIDLFDINFLCINQCRTYVYLIYLHFIPINLYTSDNKSFVNGMCIWLIDYLRFYVPLKNFSLIRRRHHCRWRAVKFLKAYARRSGPLSRDLYRATPAVNGTSVFFMVSSEGPPHSVASHDTRGGVEDLFLPGSSRCECVYVHVYCFHEF
jgi:hypothetical protein